MRFLKLFIVAPGVSTVACLQEGQCRELSGDVQVCASGYWQDIEMDGYSCRDGILLPNELPHRSDPASVIVGPPVQTTRQSGNDYSSTATGVSPQVPTLTKVESTSLTLSSPAQDAQVSIGLSASSTSLPQQDFVSQKGDVGHWYCKGKNHQLGTTRVSPQATHLEAQWHPCMFP